MSQRKIRRELVVSHTTNFHKDVQKPDSQPETPTLWAGKKHTPPFRPCGACNHANDERTRGPAALTSPKCARARRGPAPSASAHAGRALPKPAPSGTVSGFRPEAQRSPFGSGSSSTLAREPFVSPGPEAGASVHFRRRTRRQASGDASSCLLEPAEAPALGAAAPSGAE